MDVKADIESSTKLHLFLGWWEILHRGDWHSMERARHYLHGFRMAIDSANQLAEEAQFLYELSSDQTAVYAIKEDWEVA